jgi:iron-sulfur cluster assembly protein
MAVTLTPSAVERVRQYLAETPGGIGLRFGVRKSGCSGWAYLIEIAIDERADEQVFEQEGVALRIDRASLAQVDDTVIDFVRDGLNQRFVFRNPRVTAECGCGESFTTNEQAA